jgi:hypothetical protein
MASAPTGSFAESLLNLLWPTKFLALGTVEMNFGANAEIWLANAILFLSAGGLSMLAVLYLKVPSRYAFQLLVLIPILTELWFSGFDPRFIEWAPLAVATIFYSGLGACAAAVTSAGRGKRKVAEDVALSE